MPGHLDEHVRTVGRGERAVEPEPRAHELESGVEQELEGVDAVETPAQLANRVERGLDVVERQERDDGRGRMRDETQRGRGDDAERPLAAAQQAREVVAGVVLLEAVEAADDPAVGEHDLDADQLPPRGPVPQHVHTARVGGDRAADRRDITRGEIDSVLPARGARVRLQARERHPGVRDDLPGARVDGLELVEPPQVDARSRRASGTDPPTSPVFPPWGTTAAPCALHARSTAATCSVSAGATTAGVLPRNRPVQSTTCDSTTSGSVRT